MASGCASGARSGAMIAPVTAESLISESSPAHAAIAIAGVTGGQETNPMWMSKVSNENFRDALEQSLRLHAMLATGHPRYMLTAELQSLSQPIIGIDMTVTSKVHYRLVSAADQSVALDQVIETPYTAQFGEAFLGSERLRLANEGAIRVNIDALIKSIVANLRPA
jgi:hypothetical protein